MTVDEYPEFCSTCNTVTPHSSSGRLLPLLRIAGYSLGLGVAVLVVAALTGAVWLLVVGLATWITLMLGLRRAGPKSHARCIRCRFKADRRRRQRHGPRAAMTTTLT